MGIGLGALAAMNHGGWIDRAIIAVSVIGVSTPVFFFALILMIYLGYHWQLFPFLGRAGPIWTLEGLHGIVLPAMTLGLSIVWGDRAHDAHLGARRDGRRPCPDRALQGVPRADRGAEARAPQRAHSVVTLIGLQAGFLLGGAVVTETIFSWPGVGRMAVGAILARDMPLAQGALLSLAIAFIVINMAVDLAYAALDPG